MKTALGALEVHAGCSWCGKKCLHNGPVATKEVAARSERILFACNDRKFMPNKEKRTWMGRVMDKLKI